MHQHVASAHADPSSDALEDTTSRSLEEPQDRPDNFLEDDKDLEKDSHIMVNWDGPQDPHNPRNWPLLRRAGIFCIIWINVWALDWAGSADSQAASKIATQFHVSEEAETLSPALYTFGIGTGALFAGPISGMFLLIDVV